MTNLEKIRLIEETIEREIRPLLRQDGGDIELIDVQGARVVVSLRGMCAHCQVAQFTLKDVVQAKLREFVAEDLDGLLAREKSAVCGRLFDTALAEAMSLGLESEELRACFEERLGRALPTGIFDGDEIDRYLSRIFSAPGRSNDFRKLRHKLYIVAAELDTGESVAFGAPGVDPISLITTESFTAQLKQNASIFQVFAHVIPSVKNRIGMLRVQPTRIIPIPFSHKLTIGAMHRPDSQYD